MCHALDYDCSVLPSSLVLPHAARIDSAVGSVLRLLLDFQGEELPAAAQAQAWLPRRCGGLQLSSVVHLAPLARAATLVTHGQSLRNAIEAWQQAEQCNPPLDSVLLDEISLEAPVLVTSLQQRGIAALTGVGAPTIVARDTPPADMMRVGKPAGKLLSAYLAASGDHGMQKLMDRLDQRGCARLQSAAGPSAGSLFTAQLSFDGVHMADWQFTEALRFRLGLSDPGPLANMQESEARWLSVWLSLG